MALSRRVRRGIVVAVVAVALPIAPGATAGAAVTGLAVGAPTSVERLTGAPGPAADPSPTAPTPGPSVPSEAEVSEAQEAAAAAAKEVAEIKAEVERAEARLETLQRGVSGAVAAQHRAEQQLADADAALRKATADLAAARHVHAQADRTLSGRAAQMYMQGGDLQNLTTLLLSPPEVMSDLAMVLDQQADRVRENLDAATSAAVDAAIEERLLVTARENRAVALQEASAKRTTAEKAAAQAGAEAARLGEQQEKLTARLEELEKGAADLAGLREAAARLSTHPPARPASARRARDRTPGCPGDRPLDGGVVRLGRGRVHLPRRALARRVGVELERHEPVVRRLRHPSGPAGLEDVQRGQRLAHQPRDADHLGDGLYRVRLQVTVRRIRPVPGPIPALVLTQTNLRRRQKRVWLTGDARSSNRRRRLRRWDGPPACKIPDGVPREA